MSKNVTSLLYSRFGDDKFNNKFIFSCGKNWRDKIMGRSEALNTILKHFLSTKDFGQAREDINNLIELELLQQQEELER